MIVVVSLAECNQGDKPAVAAGIFRPVGLTAPDMADGIDAKRGVQNRKGSSHAGEQKAADAADQPVGDESDEKRQCQAAQHDERVMLMLPDGYGVLRDTGGVLHIVILPFGEEPATVTVPEPELGVVGVALLIALRMMSEMIGRPLDGAVLQGPGACDEERAFDPVGAIKAAVRHEAVIAHGDPEAADEVEDGKQRPIQPGVIVKISVGGDGKERSHHDGKEENNRPPDMVAASQAYGDRVRRHRLVSERITTIQLTIA